MVLNRQLLRSCFPTAHSPTARYYGLCLVGVTFNFKLSDQFLRAVPKMRAVGRKTTPTAHKKRFLRAVGVEDILRWDSTLKPCKELQISKDQRRAQIIT